VPSRLSDGRTGVCHRADDALPEHRYRAVMEGPAPATDVSFVRRALRSPLLDALLAIALAGYAAAEAMSQPDWPEPRPVSAALAALAGLFLAVRRSRPLTSLTGALGVLAMIGVALGHYEAGAGLLIGLVVAYSAGAWGDNTAYALAVLTGFALSEGIGQPASEAVPDVLWTCAALALPFGVGRSVRRLTSRARTAEGHAQRLRQERQAVAAAAAAAERRRIAHELHDVISHGLAVVILQAGAADQVLDSDPGKAREALRQIRATGQEAINGMGTLVGLARGGEQPPRAPMPTLADLEHLVATTRSAGLAVSLRAEGQPRVLEASVELNAYRVAQEGLANALKHAHDAEVHVVLRYRPDELEVEVSDDAAGTAPGLGSRLGIVGLRERAAVFGGRLHAGPGPHGGWTLRASFPAPP
jgi:signal transduction histidine kinase